MKTLVDSQEFRDILGDATETGSLASYMSTFNREKTINDQVVNKQKQMLLKQDLTTSNIMWHL